MRIISIFFLFLCLVQGVQAQKSSMPGYITGDDVFLRADHTTQSKAITTLDKGQRIFIISSYRPKGNDNEAILRVNTDFYDEDFGVKLFTLPKGKAVVVNGLENDMYRISFRNIAQRYARSRTSLLAWNPSKIMASKPAHDSRTMWGYFMRFSAHLA